MARLNIDDGFYVDPRFKALVRKVGNEDLALGMCVRFWRTAQHYWGMKQSCVPEDIFKLEDLEVLIEVGIAKQTESGIYAIGSKDYFEWYREKVSAAQEGGKRSAEARRKKFGSAVPINASNSEAKPKHRPKQNRSTTSEKTEALPNPPDTALVITPVNLIKSPPERTESATAVEISAVAIREKKPGEEFIALYCDTYRARYNARPAISGRDAGIAKRLIGTQGLPASLALVRAYLAMDDTWFVTKHHDLPTLEENLNKVAVHLQTGGQGPPPKETWIERRKREALERETKEQELKNAQ